MRYIFYILLGCLLHSSIIAQDKAPTKEEMKDEFEQSIRDARHERDELRARIAEARKNKEDAESISEMEKQLTTVNQMIAMLEKSNPFGKPSTKPVTPQKNTEPAYVSPFTPITLKQPVRTPTWAQASDRLLWYRGRRIDGNTLITPSGMIVRYNRQSNLLLFQPDIRKDTPYYGLVNTLKQLRPMRNDFSRRMVSIVNSFFMFEQIDEAYKEYDVFKNRYYSAAQNTIQLPGPSLHADLESKIQNLADYLRNLSFPPVVLPPKRPNDLCLCRTEEATVRYRQLLDDWIYQFFADEDKILMMLYEIAANMEFMTQTGSPISPRAQGIADQQHDYFKMVLERMKVKVEVLADKYDQGDVLMEDGLVLAARNLVHKLTIWNPHLSPEYGVTSRAIARLWGKIIALVESDIFERYIQKKKSEKDFNVVFDYALYAAHELNKKILNEKTRVNDGLFQTWIESLKKYNRFTLSIELDFNYQQVSKPENDRIKMWANGTMKSDDMTVSLGIHDCQWHFYLTDQNHSNRNTTEEEFKIPIKVLTGRKDYVDDKMSEFAYEGPAYMRMVFPTFQINFCGGDSKVMMDVLSYTPRELQRHSNDKLAMMYTTDILQYANKMFLGAKKTEFNVNKAISTAVDMITHANAPMSESTDDPAYDRSKEEHKMNKKKYDLQFRLSQTTHTGKTVIPLVNSSSIAGYLFRTTKDLADPNDEDRTYGIILTKGEVTIRVMHVPL